MQCWWIQLDEVYQQQKLVLMNIPENHRRESVKDTDVVNEELPTERALGVHWDVEKDQLCFKLNLKTGNITRRGMLSTLISYYDPLGLASPFILKGRKILQYLCQEGCKGMKRYQKCIKRNGNVEKMISLGWRRLN